MAKGLFITFEGSDGSGKSTQLALAQALLTEKGYNVTVTREPGGTVISEKIRELLLDRRHSEMTGKTEALLYAAARAQHVDEVIMPALTRGDIVMCDRFTDSSVVYQGYGRKLGADVETIDGFATGGCTPDMTFFLKINHETAGKRIRASDRDRLESEREEFYNEVFKGYMELEQRHPDRITGIDASKAIEEIHAIIRAKLKTLLKGKQYDLK